MRLLLFVRGDTASPRFLELFDRLGAASLRRSLARLGARFSVAEEEPRVEELRVFEEPRVTADPRLASLRLTRDPDERIAEASATRVGRAEVRLFRSTSGR